MVVARAGLGIINHSLLTVQTMKNRGCACAGIILMDTYDAVDELSRKENTQATSRLGDVFVSSVIGRENTGKPSAKALDGIAQIMGPISAKDQDIA